MPVEVPDEFWPPKKQQRKCPSKSEAMDCEQKKATASSEKNPKRKPANNTLRNSRWKERLCPQRSQQTRISDVRRRDV